MRTFFDEDNVADTKEARAARLQQFPLTYVPHAEDLPADIRICATFFEAINKGVQILPDETLPAADKTAWAKAQAYLDARPS